MARIRSIHPGLATDEAFMAMTPITKAAWPLLWTECDDQGAFEWKPLVLKARVLPADPVDFATILAELESLNSVKRYEVGGKVYGLVRNFGRYQRPKKPANKYPVPSEYRPFAGLTPDGSEPVPNQYGTSGEKSPQMKEEGGSRKELPQPLAQHSGPAALRSKEEYDRIEGLCRQAAGLVNDAAIDLNVIGPIIDLLEKGYSLEGDVLPILRAKAAGGKKARSWKFYVPAIVDARTSRDAIPKPLSAKPEADWPARAERFQRKGWLDEWGDQSKIPAEFQHLFKAKAA